MKYSVPGIILMIIFLSGCNLAFWKSEEKVEVFEPIEEVVEEEEFEKNELQINLGDPHVAVCGPSAMLVKDIYQENLQLKFNVEFIGDLRETSATEALRVGGSIEITNNDGKYCRYKIDMIGKEFVRLTKVE